MSRKRYAAGPDGSIIGPEANNGDGGTIAYACDDVKGGRQKMAERIAEALNAHAGAVATLRAALGHDE